MLDDKGRSGSRYLSFEITGSLNPTVSGTRFRTLRPAARRRCGVLLGTTHLWVNIRGWTTCPWGICFWMTLSRGTHAEVMIFRGPSMA